MLTGQKFCPECGAPSAVSPVNTARDEVDGVAALYLDEGVVPGPLQACLIFGVGRSDETLSTSGITHAVEHLALRSLGSKPYGWNGEVGLVSTRFSVIGEPEQVSEFLFEVTKRLHDLPTDRLSDELKILLVEGGKRSRSQFGVDLATRFGATGAGLIDWREAGFLGLEGEEIQQWAHSRLSAQNAALWVSGPLPAGLDLSALSQGQPVVRHDPHCLTTGRTFVGEKFSSTSLSVLSQGQWGVNPALSMVRQRAFDKLRLDEALCYEVGYTRERIGSATSLNFLMADGAPGAQRQIFDGLVDMMEEMAAQGPSSEELDSYKQRFRQWRDHPGNLLSYLDATCERTVLGLDSWTFAESCERTLALNAEEIAADLDAVMPTLLATGSDEVGEIPGWTIHEEWSTDVVPGRTYTAIEGREEGHLVIGDEGISWLHDADHRRTVHWDDVAACFTSERGDRHVVASDGTYVMVIPWSWQGGSKLAEIVDSHVPSDRRLETGEDAQYVVADQDHPDSVVDVRWLASIVGAFCRQQRVDLVIDTDGLLLLFGAVQTAAVPNRLKHLRSLDRESLLSGNPSNRWIPDDDIEEVTLGRRRLARINTLKSTLTIRTSTAEELKVHLVSDEQMSLAKRGLSKLLGARFRE